MADYQSKSLVVITGASRGIGRAIAVSIAGLCGKESSGLPLSYHMVLIARSGEKLAGTVRLIEDACDEVADVTTSCHEVDLSNLDTLPDNLNGIFDPLKHSSYEHCWLFNNAGSVEPLGATAKLADGSMNELRGAIDLNVTSAMWMSSSFAKTFTSSSLRVVNISSLCAIEPFSTMAVYCAGKAARDMFHMVLAKEISDKQNFKVISYAPGACDTAMTDVLAESKVLDGKLHDYFANSKEESTLINPADSARKLIDILVKDDYISGSHIDYWD